VTCFLPMTEVFAFSRSRSPMLSLLRSRLASLSRAFGSRGSSVNFPSQRGPLTRVKSTTRFVGAAASSVSKGHESEGSVERIESAQLSNVGSHSGASDDTDEGYRTQSYYFGPLTMKVSHISVMIDIGYFAKGMSREPGEETVLEPNGDEAVLFDEFCSAGLRMPPHHVLANILLKF
jgi:hypothetical protein